MQNQDLVNIIKELEEENFELEDRVEQLRQFIATSQSELASGQTSLLKLQNELEYLKQKADLTEVTGAGFVVTIDDNVTGAEAAKSLGLEFYRPDDYIIHFKNILYLINEFRNVADAISVNGLRIVSTTDVRCVGTVILVNTTRLAPPYEIKVIGDISLLAAAIIDSDELSYLDSRGYPVDFRLEDELTIGAYRGTFRFNHAQIVKEGEL